VSADPPVGLTCQGGPAACPSRSGLASAVLRHAGEAARLQSNARDLRPLELGAELLLQPTAMTVPVTEPRKSVSRCRTRLALRLRLRRPSQRASGR